MLVPLAGKELQRANTILLMVDWWVKATAGICTATGFFWGVHFWNEHYRRLGQTHPITAFLENYMTVETEDRLKRIAALKREEALAEKRLKTIRKLFPHLAPKEVDTDKSKQLIEEMRSRLAE